MPNLVVPNLVPPLGTPEEERGWCNEAIEAVYHAWENYTGSTDLLRQARALDNLHNALSDLWTYHPDWDFESGILGEPEDG